MDAEYQNYIVHRLGLARGTCLNNPEQIARAPMNGREKYIQLQQMWIDLEWSCIGDYLEYYNTKDVVSFLRAVIRYTKGLQDVIMLMLLGTQYLYRDLQNRFYDITSHTGHCIT